MKRLQRLLVPVDFSRCSKAALEYALHIARAIDARVEAAFAWTVPEYVSPLLAISVAGKDGETTLQELGQSDATRRMREFLAGFDLDIPGGFVARVDNGETVDNILLRATGADALIMGTHGRTGLDRMMVGSVTERVVRMSDQPVFVLNNPAAAPKKVLVAVDFSDASRRALLVAHRLAGRIGAEVAGLHVVEHVPAAEGLELLVHKISGEDPQDLVSFALAKAKQELEFFLSNAEGHEGLAIDIRYGAPHEEIIGYAEEHGFDLVVMGTRGRPQKSRVKLGGVAIKAMRSAKTPLLLVPPPLSSPDH